MDKRLIITADGGARGNPGPAAVGYVIKESSGEHLCQRGKTSGRATNHVAEYQAVIEALTWIAGHCRLPVLSLRFRLDSKLVVNQLNGLFKIKDDKMRIAVVKIRQLERKIGGNVSYQLIPRHQNSAADQLVNQALDRQSS